MEEVVHVFKEIDNSIVISRLALAACQDKRQCCADGSCWRKSWSGSGDELLRTSLDEIDVLHEQATQLVNAFVAMAPRLELFGSLVTKFDHLLRVLEVRLC